MNSTLLATATDRSDTMVVMQKLASTANAAANPIRSFQCMFVAFQKLAIPAQQDQRGLCCPTEAIAEYLRSPLIEEIRW
jgi:hypothetical protein